VTGFDHPAARAPLGNERLLGDLTAACADMPSQPVGSDQLADFAVVIRPVQAEALGSFALRLRALDRDRVQGALQQLVIVAVRAGVIEPDRNPSGVGEDRALRSLLALSVGFGPVYGPPVPWSSRRQPRGTTSRSRPARRTPTAPGARSRGTPRPRAPERLSSRAGPFIRPRVQTRGSLRTREYPENRT
jgi:hypothetical protein